MAGKALDERTPVVLAKKRIHDRVGLDTTPPKKWGMGRGRVPEGARALCRKDQGKGVIAGSTKFEESTLTRN